jgi:hypothetical protein
MVAVLVTIVISPQLGLREAVRMGGMSEDRTVAVRDLQPPPTRWTASVSETTTKPSEVQ